jgi:hypothetical protein
VTAETRGAAISLATHGGRLPLLGVDMTMTINPTKWYAWDFAI